MRLRILALAVVAMVFVGAHVSHIPLLAAANEIQMTAAQSMHHGMSGFVVGGSRSQASADVHTANAVNVSACCTDVVLGIPSRPALLAIAALLATAFAIAMHFAPSTWWMWTLPVLAASRRRAILQVYLN